MNLVKKLKQWCPQPKAPIAVKAHKLSAPIIAFVVIAEIILLLVAPLAYFALLVPKPEIKLFQTYPLTDSQIKEAWPNLPSAQQIVNNGLYSIINTNNYIILSNSTANKIYLQTPPHWWDNSSSTTVIQNETLTNSPDMLLGGIVPVTYHIWLQLNATMWIGVPQTYLNNSGHPPTIPSETNNGFLGTNMPATYVVVAIATISVTIVASVRYLISTRQRMKQQLNFNR